MRRSLVWSAALALLVASTAIAGTSTTNETELELWPFASATIVDHGHALKIDAYLREAEACIRFDHVETIVEGRDLLVSLYYQRDDNKFCQVPCPIGVEQITVELDEPVDPDLRVIENPATPLHC